MAERREQADRRDEDRVPKRGRRSTDDPAWCEQVNAVKDAILVSLGRQFDEARQQRGWTILEGASRARLSKRGLIALSKTTGNPTLTTLIAMALALGGSLEITYHPPPSADEGT